MGLSAAPAGVSRQREMRVLQLLGFCAAVWNTAAGEGADHCCQTNLFFVLCARLTVSIHTINAEQNSLGQYSTQMESSGRCKTASQLCKKKEQGSKLQLL